MLRPPSEPQGGRIRARTFLLVASGFLAGALSAYYALWRLHALVPGHPLARRTSEVLSPPARPPRTVPVVPTQTTTASPTATPASARTPIP